MENMGPANRIHFHYEREKAVTSTSLEHLEHIWAMNEKRVHLIHNPAKSVLIICFSGTVESRSYFLSPTCLRQEGQTRHSSHIERWPVCVAHLE